MATAPEQIQLSSELQQELARLADHAGKPWETVLSEALASYRASRLPDIAGESVTEAMVRLGLLGCVNDAPADLSTNHEHMRGYGQDEDSQPTFEMALDQPITMTPEEQLAFWNALHEPVKLTPAQKKLGAIIRGEA